MVFPHYVEEAYGNQVKYILNSFYDIALYITINHSRIFELYNELWAS